MSRQPEPWKSLREEIRKIQADVRRLLNASPFFGTGMHPNGSGGLDSDSFVDSVEGFSLRGTGDAQFNGPVVVNGPLDINGALDVTGPSAVTGNMTISGNLDVTGTFTLPAQSISNSWLANLTGWSAVTSSTATAWATSTSMADKASTSVTVPTGYTTALVVAWGLVTFQDTAANRFDTRCMIEGNAGPTLINLANTVGQTTVLHSRSLAVTSGQVLNLSVQVLSAVATAGHASNTAVAGGVALFAR